MLATYKRKIKVATNQMSIPPHPLTKPHLDKLAGLNEVGDNLAAPEEIERRVQALLLEWQKSFFSGDPFTTPLAGQPDETKTFVACEILWGRSAPELPGKRPVLHTLLTDRRDGDPVRIPGGLRKISGEWTWNTLIRTHPQLPASRHSATTTQDSAEAIAERECRRVGDQYAWLLRSPHTQALALKGIGQLRILSGPRPVAASPWFLTQIIFTAQINFRISGNSP